MSDPVVGEVGTEESAYSAYDAIHHTGYEPPRQAGAGRPLHEPVADIPAMPRRPMRGLEVTSANRTGGATDASAVAAAFASMPRVSFRPSKRPTADDVVNHGGGGAMTDQVCTEVQSDSVLSVRAEE